MEITPLIIMAVVFFFLSKKDDNDPPSNPNVPPVPSPQDVPNLAAVQEQFLDETWPLSQRFMNPGALKKKVPTPDPWMGEVDYLAPENDHHKFSSFFWGCRAHLKTLWNIFRNPDRQVNTLTDLFLGSAGYPGYSSGNKQAYLDFIIDRTEISGVLNLNVDSRLKDKLIRLAFAMARFESGPNQHPNFSEIVYHQAFNQLENENLFGT
jgi:hypothetical protein